MRAVGRSDDWIPAPYAVRRATARPGRRRREFGTSLGDGAGVAPASGSRNGLSMRTPSNQIDSLAAVPAALDVPETAEMSPLLGLRIVLVSTGPTSRQMAMLATGLQLDAADVRRVAFDERACRRTARRGGRTSFDAALAAAVGAGADVMLVDAAPGDEPARRALTAVEEAREAGIRTVLRIGESGLRASAAAARAADLVVVPSAPVRDAVREQFGIEARIAPDLIDEPGFETPPARTDGRLRLVCMADLEGAHGVQTVLDAAAIAANAGVDLEVAVIGDGRDREALASHARMLLRDRVAFRGAVPREQLRTELGSADLFVGASRETSADEAVAAAMAAGLPVATTAEPYASWRVQHGENGLVSPARDARELARSIEMLDADRDSLVDLAWCAKVRALRWTWEGVRADWARCLRPVRAA
jgi:glycosyl transferase family 1